MRSKEVQIIPWVIADSNYVRCPSQRLEPHNTVFVGALHGMLNAEGKIFLYSFFRKACEKLDERVMYVQS